MTENIDSDAIRNKLVIKAVRNIRRGGKKEDAHKGMYRPDIKLDLQRSRLLTESYKETEGESMTVRRAKGLAKILTHMDLYIQDWERIVGNNVSTPQGLFFGVDMNYRSVQRIINEEEGKSLLNEKGRKELEEMIGYWKGKAMSDRQQEVFSGDILKGWDMSKGGAAFWSHWSELGIANYEKVFRIGLKGLIQEAEARLLDIDMTVPDDYIDQKEFLLSVIIALNAVVGFAHRYARLARDKAEKAETKQQKKQFEEIAERCEWVPEKPPRTFAEALQSFFILHVVRFLEFSTLGIGVRFDKVFGPFYRNDIKNGRVTREEALELLQLLWVKINELGLIYSPTLSAIYGGVGSLQAITIGGTDEDGNDITNDITYLILETAKTMQTLEPTLVLRYHDGTPDELLSKATDVIRTGIGYPSLFNDKSILPMLDEWDVPLKDARDYAISGCVYMEIPGKNMARKAYGGLVLPAALWFALHQGRHPATGEQIGANTADPRDFKSADDLMNAYLEQISFFFGRLYKIENTCRSLYEKYLPRPFYSALLDGCIEKGMDCRQWGYPSPVADFCVILGPTNAADGITAVKKNVFDDKTITMDELLTAMDNDWEGHDHIRQLMINAPKYGNDNTEADQMMAEVQHKTTEKMMQFKNRFGYPCRGDGSGISATYAAGATVPATPDGRKGGDPLADATLSPIFGMDQEGPTAVLKSASKVSTSKTHNHLLNQKFMPSALADDMKDIFISYLRSWGDLGISQIQFNVVDRETLIEAQNRPENHQDLLVRVAGYSAYFVDLSKGLQDSIIARTEHHFKTNARHHF